MFRLDNRVGVVTGAASGIGAATAEIFAKVGARVVLGRYPQDPHDVTAVQESGRQSLVCEVDVRHSDSVQAMFDRTIHEFGRVDIVMANAGIARKVPLEELDATARNAVLDVDLHGAWRGRAGITANAGAPGVVDTPQANDPANSLGPDGARYLAGLD